MSWIVAPTIACEHPTAPPAIGQTLVAGLLAALAAHPEVWAKTVFILNYDENDGFFDHMPPPVPAITPGMGKSTASVAGEIYRGEPVGLGPRVPMLIVSPWTKGGFVNSQLFDHTSVLRFLEARFGVTEPNITPWRRAVCGDLVSAFDFAASDSDWRADLPDTKDYNSAVLAARALPPARLPPAQPLPVQEKGQRPARPLPYALEVTGAPDKDMFALTFVNSGAAGACLSVYSSGSNTGPWFYTVEAGRGLEDRIALPAGTYSFRIQGPNGFLRLFEDAAPHSAITAASRYDETTQEFVLVLHNMDAVAREVSTQALSYTQAPARRHSLAPGATLEDRWPIAAGDHWYHLEMRSGAMVRQFAGHVETGKPSRSDPALG